MEKRNRGAAPLRIGWFSTGKGQGSRDLLTAVHSSIARGELNARIDFVFSSREGGEYPNSDVFLRLVQSFEIPLVCHSYEKFRSANEDVPAVPGKPLPPWRTTYDTQIMSKLAEYRPDVCVLAGYMLVVGPQMCKTYKMLNLHPAAPGGPTGTWREVIWQLIDSHTASTGAMMHLVTPELDKGPVVTYCIFPIVGGEFDKYWAEIGGMPATEVKARQGENNRLFQLIRRHGALRELPLVVSTLRAFANGMVAVSNGRVLDLSGREIQGYDLSHEIDKAVEKVLGSGAQEK